MHCFKEKKFVGINCIQLLPLQNIGNQTAAFGPNLFLYSLQAKNGGYLFNDWTKIKRKIFHNTWIVYEIPTNKVLLAHSSLVYLLSMATYALQWQRWVVAVGSTYGWESLKRLLSGSFQKKYVDSAILQCLSKCWVLEFRISITWASPPSLYCDPRKAGMSYIAAQLPSYGLKSMSRHM